MSIGGMVGIVGLAFFCVVLGACAPHEPADGPGGVAELRVSEDEVLAGGEVMLTLVNRSDRDLGYNLCPAALERRVAGEWVDEPLRPAEICTMELRLLSPGDSAHYRHTVPSALAAGEYRFRTGVEAPLGGGRVEIVSEAFQVQR